MSTINIDLPNKDIDLKKCWSFHDIYESFEVHARTQLPFYDMLHEMLATIIHSYIHLCGEVIDVGCANGNLFKVYKNIYGSSGVYWYHLEDESKYSPPYEKLTTKHLVDTAQDVFSDEYKDGADKYQVIVANLTLSFIDPKERSSLIEAMKQKLAKGGALIIVDKFFAPEARLATVYRNLMWAHKVQQNVSGNDIVQKEMSLIGVQTPLEIEDCWGMERFFQYGEFIGFIHEA